jgi:hypothetical protein
MIKQVADDGCAIVEAVTAGPTSPSPHRRRAKLLAIRQQLRRDARRRLEKGCLDLSEGPKHNQR